MMCVVLLMSKTLEWWSWSKLVKASDSLDCWHWHLRNVFGSCTPFAHSVCLAAAVSDCGLRRRRKKGGRRSTFLSLLSPSKDQYKTLFKIRQEDCDISNEFGLLSACVCGPPFQFVIHKFVFSMLWDSFIFHNMKYGDDMHQRAVKDMLQLLWLFCLAFPERNR